MEHLTKLDVLGSSPSFYVGGRSHMKTVQGAILSILVFGLSAIAFWFFGEKIIFAELSSSTMSEKYVDSPKTKTNEANDFSFYFGVQDNSYQHVYRPDLFEVTFNLITINKDFSGSAINFPVHRCEAADFHDNAPIFQNTINFQNAYCIPANKTEQFALNSTFGFDSYTFFQIGVTACTNTTLNQICAPQEEIDSFLDGFYFDVGFVKDIIDPTDYKSPGTKEFDDFFGVASKNYYKELYMYFKHITVRSDTGWIFENKEEMSFFGIGEVQERLDLRATPEFLKIVLRLSKEEDLFTRKYYKLQDFLAQAGGVSKALMIIAKFLYSSFCNSKMIIEAAKKDILVGNYISTSKSNISLAKTQTVKSSSKNKELTDWQIFLTSSFCCSTKVSKRYKKIETLYKESLEIRTYLSSISKIQEIYRANRN